MNSEVILSVVIPAYQEEENLNVLLSRINDVLQAIEGSEVLVIDTRVAMDDSKKVCKENNAIYINRVGGDNYGDAVRTGIMYAKGRYIIFMDADGSHTPEFIKELFVQRDNYDVVVASRYTAGGRTENNKFPFVSCPHF